MVETRDMAVFAHENEGDLRGIILSKCGHLDDDILNDHIQDIYVEMIRYRTLQKYDSTKGPFDRWITTAVSWHLSRDKAKKSNQQVRITCGLHDNIPIDDMHARMLKEKIRGYVLYLRKRRVPRLTDLLKYLTKRIYGYPVSQIGLTGARQLCTMHNMYINDYNYACSGLTGPIC